MPKKVNWTSEEGAPCEIWDLPVRLRRHAALALGPMQRLLRVRVGHSASRRAGGVDDVWLLVRRPDDAVEVLHAHTRAAGRLQTDLAQYRVPVSTLDALCALKAPTVAELRDRLWVDVVGATDLGTLTGAAAALEVPDAVAPAWTRSSTSPAHPVLDRMLWMARVEAPYGAPPELEPLVGWAGGPVDTLAIAPRHRARRRGDTGGLRLRVAGQVAQRQPAQGVVVEFVCDGIDPQSTHAQTLDAIDEAISQARGAMPFELHAAWLLDGRTRLTEALVAAVPGIALDPARRPGGGRPLLADLAWSWLLEPAATPPGGEPA